MTGIKSKGFRLDLRSSGLISVAVHGLLLLFMLFLRVSTRIEIPEFVQVQFVRGQEGKISAPPVRPRPAEAAVPETRVSKRVELPKRRTPEKEPERLRIPPVKKKVPGGAKPPAALPPEKLPPEPAPLPAERATGQPIPLPEVTAEHPVVPPEEKGKRGLVQSFEIEGKAAERQILEKVLPRYPEGLNREGTVRIRFTILPSGRVGEMIPVLKTDAALEENAMSALARWRFNPLPREAPQDTVVGIITFRYKLK